MIIFDTHCHYNMSPLVENWREYWQQAQAAGVKKTMVVGADYETSLAAREIADTDENLMAAGGFHPTWWLEEKITAEEAIEKTRAGIKKLREKKWNAIGECGLEYWQLTGRDDWEIIKKTQQEIFQMHIDWASESGLPLLLHMRGENGEVYNDAIEMLKKTDTALISVWHCFGGNIEIAKKISQLENHYISLAGNVTFKNAAQLREVAAIIPEDKLLIETDAPFLTPVPYRGQWPNAPKNIVATAEFLEKELGIDVEKVYNNSERVLKKNVEKN